MTAPSDGAGATNSPHNNRKVRGIVAGLLATTLLAGCSAATKDARDGTLADSECGINQLATRKSGRLIVATGQPAYEPWVLNDAPEQGQGFEAALAYAAAERLGFDPEDVEWMRTTFTSAVVAGRQPFDWNLQQFTITPARQQLVDFSAAYFTVTQAVVTWDGSPIADATSVAELRSARLGAAAGSTSLADARDVIRPTKSVRVFDDNADAVTALRQHQLDGIVVDLPTAFHMAAEDVEDGKLVGQLPVTAADQPGELGILLAKDSPLTECTSRVIDSLRADGTLQHLADTWLSTPTAAPVLAS